MLPTSFNKYSFDVDDIVRVDSSLINKLSSIYIHPIPLLDLFPMIKEGLTTPKILYDLFFISDCGKEDHNEIINASCSRRLVPTTIENKIISEKNICCMITFCSKQHFTNNSSIAELSIYDVLQKLGSNGLFRQWETFSLLKNIVINHPKVDLLLISVIENNSGNAKVVLRNPTSDRVFCYKFILNNKGPMDIRSIVQDELIIRLFLLRELCNNSILGKDILSYILYQGIL